MKQTLTLHESVAVNFHQKGAAFLTCALLLAAAILVYIALQPGHMFLKAGTLAWVVLP